MLRTLGIVVAIVALALPLVSRVHAYHSSTWFEGAAGHENAMRQWKTMRAPMLVYFRVDWCPHCRGFDELLEDREVRTRLAGVIKVRIDPERGEAEKRLFEAEYGGTGYPTIYLYPADGGSRRRISHRGPAEAFLAQLPPQS